MFPEDKLSKWPSGQGHWINIPKSDWGDWRWQMKNRLTKREHIEKFLSLSEEESKGFDIAAGKLLVSVTPHFFNLINTADPNCPIRKQVIPSFLESVTDPQESPDPVGEEGSMPVPGIVH